MLCSEEKTRFASAVKAGYLPHACIIEGASDEAKENFVSYVLPYILCHSSSACGVCPSCIKLKGGNHPDLVYLGGDGKAANMEAIRRLISDSRMVPVENGRKLYCIRCGEKLRKEAQNALLKVLEEPPKDVVIFILTEKRESLLPTIRSRCRMITLTDEAEEKRDKASKDAYDRAMKLIELLFVGSSRFDFYTAMCEKTTRDKLALLLKELEDGIIEVLKAKSGSASGVYGDLAAHVGREGIGEMADIISDARRANEGNANLSSLQMATAVRLWEAKR